MQFIKNGPDIPERLLQAHEDGRVVCFCGAGISYSARLPGFKGLVERLYTGLGETPSSVEQAAIKSGQYDTAISLLEGRIVGGRATVRQQLANILTPDLSAPQATATHEALLVLARSREGRYRLITTNFDRLFEEVIQRQGIDVRRNQAPLLPVPKNRWDGLVYLHGLLPATPKETDLDRLVVSSGDFGLAYLTERWAARFVSELFRSYTVCFIGYSINDPVLRYMMDALAADRLLGESPPEMFALGSHKKGQEEHAANEWKAKNVTPILYREYRHHYYLRHTLRAWAETYRDGVLGKERIVVQHAMAKPFSSTKQDDFVGRMIWALSERSGLPAKRFADLDPPPVLDWLEPLSDARFGHRDLARFGVSPDGTEDAELAFSLIVRPTPYSRAPWMTLVYGSYTTGQWDEIMHQLARWLTRHIDNPKLILWVAKHGGRLHQQFARLIEQAIEERPPSPPMQTLWRVVLANRLRGHAAHLELYSWRKRFKRDGLTPTLKMQLRELLTPCVRLREPFRGWEGDEIGEGSEPSQIKDLVDWEIVLATDHVHSALKDLSQDTKWHEILPELLPDFTSLLRDALDLMFELGGADNRHDGSYWHQPSISEHPQNRDFRDWTALIELARDAWLATAKKCPQLARLETRHWLSIPYPLFRRLVFFAAANSDLFAPREILDWLLSNDHWWLWSVETERETLRLLVTLAPKLDDQKREVLEQAILQGPPREMFRDDIEPEQLQQTFDREVWLRLAKCSAAGAPLGLDAINKLQDLTRRYPKWRLADDERDEFPVWMGDGTDGRAFLATPKRCYELVQWLREHPKSDTWQDDDWRERCKRDFRRTASALMHLAHNGEWYVDRWREALQAWADDENAACSWRCVGGQLVATPDGVLREFAHALSWWLQTIAKTFSGNEKAFFLLVRRGITLYREEGIEASDDPVFKAINHPIGQMTEAALRWWYRQALQDGQGLTEPLRSLFSELCDTQVAKFRHGRVLLAAHVISLFRVDSAWSKQYLLPLFDWQLSADEARAAWEGFLWSPRIYQPLLKEIKPQFLATASHYEELGDHGRQYAGFLTFAALDPGDTFTRKELAAATRSLPANGLHEAAQALVRALESAGEQRAEYWRNRILPYLKAIWPKSRDNITPGISEAFARLCIAAGDAFPEALRVIRPWLQTLQHPDFEVHLLYEAKLCTRYPEDALAFLDKIIGDNAQWPPSDLKQCLDAIKSIQAMFEDDDRFQRLYQYLRLHGQA